MAKKQQAMKAVETADEQIVYGAVYIPDQVDTDWESMEAEDIRKMAYSFMENGRFDAIDIMHNREKSGAVVVESFIARNGDPDFDEGTWVLGVRVPEDIWKDVKAGKLNGFSFNGTVKKVPKKVLMELTKIAIDETELSTDEEILPAHKHAYYVEFNDEGGVVMGFTDEVLGHKHDISGTTVTDVELEHAHRFFVE